MPDTFDWIIMGDFNLLRSLEDRNKPGGNILEILLFNEAISYLGIVEIPLQGRRFTWCNMQPSPLLEKLDWVFTSSNWNINYPITTAKALDITPSDHTPCLINIATRIPKPKVFRFENYWLLDEQFPRILNSVWSAPATSQDTAKSITAKLKLLRQKLREWQAAKRGLHTTIANCRIALQLLESFEDFRDLSVEEWNFKDILKTHLSSLLEKQRIYWKQRGSIKWANLGDAGTKFFHNNATIKLRKSIISELETPSGLSISEHNQKEAVLWEDFKDRLGRSEFSGFQVDPSQFVQPSAHLFCLEAPFLNEEIDGIIKALPNDKSPGPDGFNNEFMKKS